MFFLLTSKLPSVYGLSKHQKMLEKFSKRKKGCSNCKTFVFCRYDCFWLYRASERCQSLEKGRHAKFDGASILGGGALPDG